MENENSLQEQEYRELQVLKQAFLAEMEAERQRIVALQRQLEKNQQTFLRLVLDYTSENAERKLNNQGHEMSSGNSTNTSTVLNDEQQKLVDEMSEHVQNSGINMGSQQLQQLYDIVAQLTIATETGVVAQPSASADAATKTNCKEAPSLSSAGKQGEGSDCAIPDFHGAATNGEEVEPTRAVITNAGDKEAIDELM